MTRFEALMTVRQSFTSEQAMADAFGVAQPTVWRWLKQSKQLPAEHVPLAFELTGVAPHYLRPDIYPADMLASYGAGGRFDAVDQRADIRCPHAVHTSRILASHDFNRGTEMKAAR